MLLTISRLWVQGRSLTDGRFTETIITHTYIVTFCRSCLSAGWSKMSIASGLRAVQVTRLDPRPRQRTIWSALQWALLDYSRSSFLATGALFASNDLFNRILGSWRYSDQLFFVVASMTVHELMYYGMNFTFLAFDKYKIFQHYMLPRTRYSNS